MRGAGLLSWFVTNLINKSREEENDAALWDVWLHKCWDDISYVDFKAQHTSAVMAQARNDYIQSHPKETKKIIDKSFDILANFDPLGGE